MKFHLSFSLTHKFSKMFMPPIRYVLSFVWQVNGLNPFHNHKHWRHFEPELEKNRKIERDRERKRVRTFWNKKKRNWNTSHFLLHRLNNTMCNIHIRQSPVAFYTRLFFLTIIIGIKSIIKEMPINLNCAMVGCIVEWLTEHITSWFMLHCLKRAPPLALPPFHRVCVDVCFRLENIQSSISQVDGISNHRLCFTLGHFSLSFFLSFPLAVLSKWPSNVWCVLICVYVCAYEPLKCF